MNIRNYILSLMKDERNVFFDVFIKGVLCFLSWVYGVCIKLVDFGYKTGIRKEHKVGVPVISVGNITLGGTGKTPFIIFLTEYLQNVGKKPAVLTRGYGGDENTMIKEKLDNVPVFVGQDRVKNARLAVSNSCDVLVLDDGFQHRRIARDYNILMVDGVSLFGNENLFPRGVLREPIFSLKRTDIIVLTKVDMIDADEKKRAVERIKNLTGNKPIVLARHKFCSLSDTAGGVYPAEDLLSKKVCLVSGIVDPSYFAFIVAQHGADISVRIDYSDHYQYKQSDIETIRVEYIRNKADMIVVTGKDYVKIRELDISEIEENLFILNINIDIIEGKEELIAGLNSIISS